MKKLMKQITKLEEFKVLGDHRGQLVALEANRQIPFDVKRVFYIYGTLDGIPRGNHSHYKTKQFLIAVNGSCKVTLDNGKEKEAITLNKPNQGIYLPHMLWHEMVAFKPGTILLVVASDVYKESDYIRNYSEFLQRRDI